MRILAHRGLWTRAEEKNTLGAVSEAFRNGFGIETDIRDYCGRLVISHDVATGDSEPAEGLFAERARAGGGAFLALNVKADGLQGQLLGLLGRYRAGEYAVFDMSVPEMVAYDRTGIRFFTRQSEIEREPVLYGRACGVWMDEWGEGWITREAIEAHLGRGKAVGIVSPEIHGRDRSALWGEIRGIGSDDVLLCTDAPLEARRYFHG